MKLAVIGAKGLLGTALETASGVRGWDFHGFGREDWDVAAPGASAGMLARLRPDVVVNCAALIGITPCEHRPQEAFQLNAIAVRDLAIAARESGAILVQPSSHAVFAGIKAEGYDEEDPVTLTSVYAISKHAGECLATVEHPQTFIVRLPTMFGQRRNNSPGFPDKVMASLAQERTMRIATDRLDSPTFALDAAHRILDLVSQGHAPGVYHVANAGVTSYFDFAMALARWAGKPELIQPALDAEFPGLGFKPLRTALRTVRLPPLRGWREALEDFLGSRT